MSGTGARTTNQHRTSFSSCSLMFWAFFSALFSVVAFNLRA